MEFSSDQISLFSRKDLLNAGKTLRDAPGTYHIQPSLKLTAEDLQAWQQRIYDYQQIHRHHQPSQQISLWELEPPQPGFRGSSLSQTLDPFSLQQHNTEFWRWGVQYSGQPALYFVIDYHALILLYIGETLNDQHRWQGEHDCKRYLQNYVAALRSVNLPVQVGISFWPGAAAARKQRQAQEQELILSWRSPFNKENWSYWHTPFTHTCSS